MTTIRRPSTPYAERVVRPVHVAGAVSVSEPVAGFYRHKFGRSTVRAGVRIWHGPPADPVTGEIMDRGWRWQAEVNGQLTDFERVWPVCAGDPITEEEYRRYVQRKAWARENAPDSAYATGRKIDRLSLDHPLPFTPRRST